MKGAALKALKFYINAQGKQGAGTLPSLLWLVHAAVPVHLHPGLDNHLEGWEQFNLCSAVLFMGNE